mmetsp:Transcript_6649/g.13489  ORF Transcript_6649/g.13489 Transcript_6649/m.13489 type:complete len:218 (-) Transcript_6649:654-1307(-)
MNASGDEPSIARYMMSCQPSRVVQTKAVKKDLKKLSNPGYVSGRTLNPSANSPSVAHTAPSCGQERAPELQANGSGSSGIPNSSAHLKCMPSMKSAIPQIAKTTKKKNSTPMTLISMGIASTKLLAMVLKLFTWPTVRKGLSALIALNARRPPAPDDPTKEEYPTSTITKSNTFQADEKCLETEPLAINRTIISMVKQKLKPLSIHARVPFHVEVSS